MFIDQCADLVNFSSLIDPLLSLDLLGICSGSKGSESKPSTLTQSGSTTIAFCPVQRDSTFLLSGDTFSFTASNCFKSLFRLRAFPFFESPHGGAKSKPMPLRRSMRSCGLLGTAVVSVVVMMTTNYYVCGSTISGHHRCALGFTILCLARHARSPAVCPCLVKGFLDSSPRRYREKNVCNCCWRPSMLTLDTDPKLIGSLFCAGLAIIAWRRRSMPRSPSSEDGVSSSRASDGKGNCCGDPNCLRCFPRTEVLESNATALRRLVRLEPGKVD